MDDSLSDSVVVALFFCSDRDDVALVPLANVNDTPAVEVLSKIAPDEEAKESPTIFCSRTISLPLLKASVTIIFVGFVFCSIWPIKLPQ